MTPGPEVMKQGVKGFPIYRTGLQAARSIIAAVAVVMVIAACSHVPAPVEERSTRTTRVSSLPPSGIYRVRGGDTLYSIAFNYGLDWKSVAGWNGIGSPYTIFPGQELRLTEPPRRTAGGSAITTRPAGQSPTATTRPAPGEAVAGSGAPRASTREAQDSTSTSAGTSAASTAATQSPPAQATPAVQQPATSAPLSDPDAWLWPTNGRVLSNFRAGDPARKGIDIGGTEGQEIVASAAGEVVYSGTGLIGFGELIIIKHSDSMLTAYAHNRQRLVQEGARVAAGSRIAEMGRNDQNQTMLHFELRIDGKPVDPLKYLPSR